MAANALVDTSFLVAFLHRRDSHHQWATIQAANAPLPWKTCEPVLSEALHILGPAGALRLTDLLRRRALLCAFQIDGNLAHILDLIEKHANVPMSLADACLVRMTELLADPIVFTADADFQIYRRQGRRIIPCMVPT